MRTLAVAALVAVDILAASSALAAGEFTHQGWRGQAAFDDGKFNRCQMWMSAINNWDLGLTLIHTGELRLGLRNQKLELGWSALFGEKFGLRLQLDDGPVVSRVFIAANSTLLGTTLKDLDWDKRLADARLLRVNTGSRVRLFHLTGIKEAYGMLRACVAKHKTA